MEDKVIKVERIIADDSVVRVTMKVYNFPWKSKEVVIDVLVDLDAILMRTCEGGYFYQKEAIEAYLLLGKPIYEVNKTV